MLRVVGAERRITTEACLVRQKSILTVIRMNYDMWRSYD
ncbi:hypothetical protein QOZ95_003042 [Paenibacillus brasilensis]|uniref:Uncharacterized protein n=1 Tax=Paenibacillus brasilensis TaxID=128574 RepID=A0ABU0L219_9BACL|nr:hypothetical protein [Paenibacillus brasilensis]